MPMILDFIAATTGHEKIAYVAHSQGTTQMFAGLTRMQDYYKDRLSLFVALGPVTKLPNTELSTLHYAGNHYGQVDDAVWMSRMHSIGSSSDPGWLSKHSKSLFCGMVHDFCFHWA